ncbi:recombinase family protein [Actinomyces sp. HMSC065F11]|uniref:recombinase family protein n=1 Tax=Actinomyces sp. HMSC065F11 TaxID=1739395 RepID=UPI0008A5B585|nr:recombinase family protein [Actinomyces sp. HMSC065F11]OFR30524.1 hypothetical protein HMPREF2891_05745 [Actinomyces sp. HMSC065F11]
MRPFGYDDMGLNVVEEEAKAIKDAAQEVIDGKSLRATARSMPIKTTAGNSWSPTSLKRVLISPRVAGKIERGMELVEAPWPAILSEGTWDAVRAKLEKPSQPKSRRLKYMLSGIAVCGLCGSELSPGPTDTGRRSYVCMKGDGGCGRLRCQAQPLENDVAERFLARLAVTDLDNVMSRFSRQAEVAIKSIEEGEAKLREAGASYARGNLRMPELEAVSQTLHDDIGKAKAIIEKWKRAQLLSVEAEEVTDWWLRASPELRRDLLSVTVDRVEVGPALVRGSKLYDPRRTSVVWRE